LFLLLLSTVSMGQVTATYTFSVLGGSNVTNPSGNIDTNISYTSAKNAGTTAATYNSSGLDLRLYYSSASPYSGSSINLAANNGVTITGVEFESFSTSYMPTVRYSIGAAGFSASDPIISRIGSTPVYKITGLNITSSMKIRNANTANEQLRMMYIKVTYMPSGPTVTTTAATSVATTGATLNGTINANGVSTAASFDYGTSLSYGSTATASPSTATGTSATSISAAVTSLALNTQYHYRAVGTVSAVPTNGTDMTFYTLAATPGVLVVNNALQTTLDVTVNATTENSNPAATTFAIREGGGQYVQANGTLGATAVWQTAATWGTKTVTGLTTSTTYNFSAKARNGDNVETAFGTSVGGTTLAAQLVDYNRIQFPNTEQTITVGGSLDVYTRAYEPGLTTNSGAQASLKGWVGYSSTNDDPANAVWTWVAATFNAESGDEDEYKATLSGLPIGTYYYAGRFQIGTGPYVYGGTGGNWNNDSVKLNVNPDVVDYANVFTTGSTTITQGETKTIFAQVYEPGVTPGAGAGAGITAQIGYSTSNTTPDGTWTWISAVYNVEVGNNDEYKIDLGTGLAPGTYYIASRFIKSGSSTYVYGGSAGIWNNNSITLTVVADVVDYCNIQYPASGAITEGMTFDIYAQVYEAGVTNPAGQGAGITAQIGYSTTNGTPDGTWTWLSAAYHADGIGANVNNDEYKVTFSGLAPGTYYYASRFIKSGSTTYVYGGTNGSPWSTSGVLTVNVLGTPVAGEATNVESTSFTANWSAVTDAVSYELDVYTLQAGTSVTDNYGFEGDTNFPTGWVGTGYVQNSAGNANTGTYFAGLNATAKYIRTDLITNPTSLSFSYRYSSGTANNTVKVQVSSDGSNWTDYQSYVATGSGASTTYSASTITLNLTGTYYIQWIMTARSGGSFYFDDVSIVSGTPEVKTPIAGSPFTINAASTLYNVTGLNPVTAYHYVVRAVLGAVISPNSNEINVTTTLGTCTWDGSAWSNTTGPTVSIAAIIEGAYDTSTYGGFTAKAVTINTGGSLTVNSGDTVTIVNSLTNSLTAAAVVVENNANLLQNGSSNQNSGSITVKRYSSALKRQDYTLWSSPVAGQQLQSFSPGTLSNRFYTYDTSTNQYAAVTTPSATNFATATGYLIRMPNVYPTTATVWTDGAFVGVPNSGDYNFTMVDGGSGLRFNLVGNPYPSPIDAADFVGNTTNATNTTGTLYFWRKTNNAASPSYCTWTTGGFVSNGEAEVYDPNGVIQTGQGFFVEGTGSGTTVAFNNTMRTDNHANQFFRTSSEVERHRIWLNATGADGLFSQTMVGYMSDATNGYDATIDGKYINDGSIALTSLIDATPYAIQGRSMPFDAADIVPMQFKAATAGTFSIAIDHVDGLFNGSQDIYLRDTQTGMDHDLKASAYTFSSEAGTFDTRFKLVYTAALSVDHPTLDANTIVIYKNENQSFTINSGAIAMASIKVFDIRGRMITTQNNINTTQATITAGQTNQVLLVQVTSVDGATVTKKVVR